VSREGVQRDILPIVEGTTVNTRHDLFAYHILFMPRARSMFPSPATYSRAARTLPDSRGAETLTVEISSAFSRA